MDYAEAHIFKTRFVTPEDIDRMCYRAKMGWLATLVFLAAPLVFLATCVSTTDKKQK